MAPAAPEVVKSKPMGGYAIMYCGGAVDWKAHRFHTHVPDVCSGETLLASRLGQRLVFFRRLCNFAGQPRQGPTPLFTDNDGTWYTARDATNTTRMTYVINHVRILQQLEIDKEIRTFQVDGTLNITDPLSKYMKAAVRWRHYNHLAGRPTMARKLWLESNDHKMWKPKKIVPVPTKDKMEEPLAKDANLR